MPSIPKEPTLTNSVTGASSDAGTRTETGTSVSTGTHRVHPIPDGQVTPEITSHGSGEAPQPGVLDSARPVNAGNHVDASTRQQAKSPEEQLNTILSDVNLAKCYRSQAKDLYFDASEYALTKLQEMIQAVDLDDPEKMANAFKSAIKKVTKDLKRLEKGNASDLKVTVTTQESGVVTLIPFQLNEIDQNQLKKLLKVALLLTNKAKAQRSDDPEYVEQAIRDNIIASRMTQIPALLEQVSVTARETFDAGFQLLKFPVIAIHFDASTCKPARTAPHDTRSSVSAESSQLDIANLRDFDGSEANAGRDCHSRSRTREEIAELEKKKRAQAGQPGYPPQSMVTLTIDDDSTGFFRALLAYETSDLSCLNSQIVSRDDLCEMLKESHRKERIQLAIKSAIEQYSALELPTEAWKAVVQKMKDLDVPTEVITERIFNDVIVHGMFPNQAAEGIADALGMDPGDHGPITGELRDLSGRIHRTLLTEFGLPVSDERHPGILWKNGHYHLVIPGDPAVYGSEF